MTTLPEAGLAAAIACNAMGWQEATAERFPTGSGHYVFDVRRADGDTRVVVRMGHADQRQELAEGVALMRRLSGLGVPLPVVLASDTGGRHPWMLLERLRGTDLGNVIATLDDGQLRTIATKVAAAQRATLGFGAAGRYGYAASAETAPYGTWPEVVAANLNRSRQRMASAGLFSLVGIERAERLLARRWGELVSWPAKPFLHDTTTRNVIVGPDGTFSGIVDVDDLCFGDPRWAPALTLAVLLAHHWPVQYVGYWLEAAGLEDDHLFRLYVAVFLLDLMSEHGQRFNGNERPSKPEERERVLRAFEAAIAAAER